MVSPAQKRTPASRWRSLRFWLTGGLAALLLLCAIVLLVVAEFISDPSVMKKIQTAMAEQSGVEVVFESIGVNVLPTPSIALHNVLLNAPGQGQAEIAELRAGLALLPLLVGDVRLQRLVLARPVIKMALPAARTADDQNRADYTGTLNTMAVGALSSATRLASGFELVIREGLLTLERGQESRLSAVNIDMNMMVSADGSRSAMASVQGSVATLSLRRNGQTVPVGEVLLDGRLGVEAGAIRCLLKRLALSEPRLEISGELVSPLQAPGVTLSLQGHNIDVDATRRVARALAADIEPVRQIFDYLGGGLIPRITVTSQGQSISDLGELANLHITGRLERGRVSVPQIRLDLTEVRGDVVIADGILSASELSTRLEGSSGSDGTLKVGLGRDNDLFSLDLMLNADLAQAKRILERIVKNQAFNEELQRITALQGAGSARLILGDSLNDLRAEVDAKNLHFTADYQRLPEPLEVTSGQVVFSENTVRLEGVTGSLGQTTFSRLAGLIFLADGHDGSRQGLERVQVSLDGRLDREILTWLETTLSVPEAYRLHPPVTLSDMVLGWHPSSSSSIKGELTINDGPMINLDVSHQVDQLLVRSLKVGDSHSDAEMSLVVQPDVFNVEFSGVLQDRTLADVFVGRPPGEGRIEGTFTLRIPRAGPSEVAAGGQLTGSNLRVPVSPGEDLVIAEARLTSADSQISVDLQNLSWRGFLLQPVRASVAFSGREARVKVEEARLCGVSASGEATLAGDDLTLDLTVAGRGLDVATSYTCLTDGRVRMTGSLDISSQIRSKSPFGDILVSMQGPLQMTFKDGLIESSKALARTLEVVNVTEIVKGRLPNLDHGGFAYKTMTLEGEFKDGKLFIDKYLMEGETLDLLGYGEIDLEQRIINVELMAAPLKTVDTVVKSIPGVNYLMAGSLVAIPVSIKGSLDDPKVQVMSASSIGSNLLNLGKRTINAPLKLIETFVPGSKKNP